jgi:uncharacterized protein (DUF1330 family)
MTPRLIIVAILLCGTVLASLTAALAAEQHPRLFLTPERVAAVRKNIAVDESYHAMVFTTMKARVDNPDMAAAYGEAGGYFTGYKAVEAAFLSAVAVDAAEKTRYAEVAFKAMTAWKGGSATLGASMEARCLALTYDWAYPAWTDAQRATVRKRVDGLLGALKTLTHGNLGGDRSSNFVGVIRGAELMLVLASGADVTSDRAKFLIGELKRYLDSFGDLGASQEGPGYTEYPAPFTFAAAYMAREMGDATLVDAAAKHAFWKGILYARSCGSEASLMWGVGGGGDYSEGWSSQLFHLCPPDQAPYYLWWYDRHQGYLSPATRPHRFDSDRHGSVWALLYYPTDVKAKDPTGIYPMAVADSRGYLFFRNRWRDADDIQASLTAQVKLDEKGWNQPEQLALNLLAYGTRFIGGPAKVNTTNAYSSLLVDGKYDYKNATERMGKVIAFAPSKTGGYAIAQGGQMFEVRGVKEATRHLLVEFQAPASQAIVATLDHIVGAGEHTYTWQANVGSPEGDDGITVTAGVEAGRPTFLMKGATAGFVKGWVLGPADAKVTAGDPLQISVTATNADLLVVMFVGQGEPPVATVKGDALTVAGRTVCIDAATGRIACK